MKRKQLQKMFTRFKFQPTREAFVSALHTRANHVHHASEIQSEDLTFCDDANPARSNLSKTVRVED
jgi:hypothetical protein